MKPKPRLHVLCRMKLSMLCALNDNVILPQRWRGLPKQTRRGVVLPEGQSCMFSSLEDARSDSTGLSLSALFKRMYAGQQPSPYEPCLSLWPALRSRWGAAGKVGEVPVVLAILDVISSVSLANTESIISP